MSMNLRDVVYAADWSELRAQKVWLAEQNCDEAEGLLNFLDHIQDAAIYEGAVSIDEVYDDPHR